MATFAYEVSPYRRKDGTYLIKVRMIHNRRVIRKPTSVYVRSDQLTRDLSRIKDARVMDFVNRYLDDLRMAEASVDGSEFYGCEELWEAVVARKEQVKGFRLDLYVYAEGKMSMMEPKTADGYRNSLNALRRFTGRDSIDINEITYPLLVGFRTFMEKANGKGCRSASYYLSCLRHLHNLAREEFNDEDVGLVRIPRQPFKKSLIPPQPVTEHRTLSVGQMKAIAQYRPCGVRATWARDVFLLSFCLIGMNTVDLFMLEKNDLRDGVLSYNRAKTDSVRKDKALMRVKVEPEAKEIIDRHKGRVRLLDFADRYSTHRNFNLYVNRGLKEIGDALGIERLTTYHARHTWATMARNDCDLDFDTVHRGLNHASKGTDRITDIYVERDWSKIWDANRRVLDYVFGERADDKKT